MTIYNEIALIDGSKLLKKFKEQISMENVMVCNIQTNCKCSIGGVAEIICSNLHQQNNKRANLLDQLQDED